MLCITAILGIVAVSVIIVLVVVSMFQHVPQVEDLEPLQPVPNNEWLKTAYQATTSLYIEVDREIWQISTIFVSASLFLMGWVVTRFNDMDFYLMLLLGCASIILVGLATLFKHRLRAFNLVHISYLRRLERAATGSQASAEFWGLHYLRRRSMMSKGSVARTMTSIHGVMDIYFFLFIVLWVAIWLVGFVNIPG